MEPAELIRAIEALGEQRLIIVCTCNAGGVPHVGAAGDIEVLAEAVVVLTEWFCPQTVANAEENADIAIVVYNPGADTGYQLLGQVAECQVVGMLDGYLAEEEEGEGGSPRLQRRLTVDVYRVLAFRRAPHSDEEV